MRKVIFTITTLIFLTGCKESKPKTILENIFDKGSPGFQSIVDQKDKYEIQILFSPVNRKGDSILIEDHFFNFRPDDYFYPASSVKMPVAFLALQKLEELKSDGINIDIHTPLTIDSVRSAQTSVQKDTTSPDGYASIGHYIEKLFTISDNDAYNRLYEFTGPDYINSHLRNKQIFTNSRIIHRVGVGGFSYEENKYSPRINFLDKDEKIVFTEPDKYGQGMHITLVSKTSKGKAYIDSNGKKVEEPFDFSKKNFINIRDLQESLKRAVHPELFSPLYRYRMSEEKRTFLMNAMSKLPRDMKYLENKTDEYYDGYVKFFLFGDTKDHIPDHITIRNKVGYAYGYLTDCAHIVDEKEGIEYYLTATIHVNENKTYNDGVYEYDDVGIPFLAELGRLVHEHMISTKARNNN